MSYIDVERTIGDKIKTIRLEYDRASIVEMEKMGYNAVNPSEKLYTNFEILIYGGMLKHQPKTTWKDAIDFAEFMKEEYGMMEVIENLNEMVNEVFTLEGKTGKKLIRKGK